MPEHPTRIGSVADEVRRLHDEKDEAQRQEHMAKNAERAAEARVAELEAAIREHLQRMAEGGWGSSDRLLSDALEKKGKDAHA